ncbi:MAG: DUF3459 domain-containing protein [Labilithrix sp.]|nr:DUF3459 domain-containing protein [Labilithrix sp.]
MTDLLPGAHLDRDEDATTFVVFSTTARRVEVKLEGGLVGTSTYELDALGAGRFARRLAGIGEGALYKLVLDGDEIADPYARFLPRGVHGPARVEARRVARPLPEPLPPSRWILYELHVGTFSPEGTYRGAAARLDAVADLGVTAIELLPIAAFAGQRGWGYDGVALCAPHAPYGEPEDLRALVRAAHERGLAMILDVVYNHVGPAGSYLARCAPEYFTEAIQTPWGPAPDYAEGSPMRRLVLESARHWLEDFGFDALRLDAVHAIHDVSLRHVAREIVDLAHAMTPPRRVFFEDERDERAAIVERGADAVWADRFHHQLHVLLTRERAGYYAAFAPSVEALAATIAEGVRAVEPDKLVYCIQNHDQIGNRALGTRITDLVDVESYCAASTLLLFLPATPLLFMGQEWAASSPFLYFCDHDRALGEAVREGRRIEHGFAGASIPDPQAARTFERSKLAWEERRVEPHARVLALYCAMVKLRRDDAVLGAPASAQELTSRADRDVLEVVRRGPSGSRRLVVNFGDAPALAPKGSKDVLFATRPTEDGKLAPRSAIVFRA